MNERPVHVAMNRPFFMAGRERVCQKNLIQSNALTQTFDFARGLLHCAPGYNGYKLCKLYTEATNGSFELFSQHETDSAAPRCASA